MHGALTVEILRVSIRVEPERLAEHADVRPFAYVVTMGSSEDKAHVHVIATAVTVSGALVTCKAVGNSTRRNIGINSSVTLIWPPAPTDGGESGPYDRYTLIADGYGSMDGESVVVSVDGAILHRPA